MFAIVGTNIYIYLMPAAAAKSHQLCPTLCDPIDGSPAGSPPPWDPPGKNTGVGCHFLLQCMKVKSESEVAQPRTILMLGLVIIKTNKVSSPTEITF